MTLYSQVTMNARDARRKLDLQNIAQALEVYYQKNGSYPVDWVYSANTAWIPSLVPDYVSSLPQDPKLNSASLANYGYHFCSRTSSCYFPCEDREGQWYMLFGKLENSSDGDRNETRQARDCSGDVFMSAFNKSYIITPDQ